MISAHWWTKQKTKTKQTTLKSQQQQTQTTIRIPLCFYSLFFTLLSRNSFNVLGRKPLSENSYFSSKFTEVYIVYHAIDDSTHFNRTVEWVDKWVPSTWPCPSSQHAYLCFPQMVLPHLLCFPQTVLPHLILPSVLRLGHSASREQRGSLKRLFQALFQCIPGRLPNHSPEICSFPLHSMCSPFPFLLLFPL